MELLYNNTDHILVTPQVLLFIARKCIFRVSFICVAVHLQWTISMYEITLLCRVCFHCIPLMTFPLRFRPSLAVPNISYGDSAQGDVKELLLLDPHSCFGSSYRLLSFCPICNFPELFMEKGEFPRKFACFPEAEEATRLVNTKWTGKLGGDQRGNSCQELITLGGHSSREERNVRSWVHSRGAWSSCWTLGKSMLVHRSECSWPKSPCVWCRVCVPHFMEILPILKSGDWTYSQGMHTDAKYHKSRGISNVKSDTRRVNPVKGPERQRDPSC